MKVLFCVQPNACISMSVLIIIWHLIFFAGDYKKGHSEKGHKEVKGGEDEEKKKKYYDEDGDEGHEEKKGNYRAIAVFWFDLVHLNEMDYNVMYKYCRWFPWGIWKEKGRSFQERP